MQIDHVILPINDMVASVAYYRDVLGFTQSDPQEPFEVMRFSDDFAVLLAPFGTEGGMHLAFAMERAEFDAAFARIKQSGVDYGNHFHDTTNKQDPAPEIGARGETMSVYFTDPSRHLIEFLYYED